MTVVKPSLKKGVISLGTKKVLLDFSKKGPLQITETEEKALGLSSTTQSSSSPRSLSLPSGEVVIHGPSRYFEGPFALTFGGSKNHLVIFNPDWGLSKVTVPNLLSASPRDPWDDYKVFESIFEQPPEPLTFRSFDGTHLTELDHSDNVSRLKKSTHDGQTVYSVDFTSLSSGAAGMDAKLVMPGRAERTLRIVAKNPEAGDLSFIVTETTGKKEKVPHDLDQLDAMLIQPFFRDTVSRMFVTAKLIPMLKLEEENPAVLSMRLNMRAMKSSQ